MCFFCSWGCPSYTTSCKTSTNTFTCASLFASFLDMFTQATSAGVSALTYQSIDFWHEHTHYTVNRRNHFSLWSRTIFACQFFDTFLRASEKRLPASGVAAGASAACIFCTSKITIESDGYPVTLPKTYFGPTHTSATSTAGVSAGVSAFTYHHKLGTVNNLWIICHFQPTNFTYIPSICTAKYTLKAL